jgi:hypothetical protein
VHGARRHYDHRRMVGNYASVRDAAAGG